MYDFSEVERTFVCADAEQQPYQAVQEREAKLFSEDMEAALGAVADDAASVNREDASAAAIPGLVDSDVVTDMGGWDDWDDFLVSELTPEQQNAEAGGGLDDSPVSSTEVRTATSACVTCTRCSLKCASAGEDAQRPCVWIMCREYCWRISWKPDIP